MIGCKQCGRCCKGVCFASICGGEDWDLIYKYWIQKEPVLVIRGRYDDPLYGVKANQYIVFDIEDLDTWEKVKTVKERYDRILFWILDEHYCPFLRQNQTEKGKFTGKYYCLLHGTGAKPKVCRDYPLDWEHARDFPKCKYFED